MTFQDTISFDRIDEEGSAFAHVPPALSDVAYFTPLEWQVIALAQRDPLLSLHAPGRLAMAMGSLFGGHMNASLADRRLEILRRVAVDIWHGREPAGEEYSDFLDAGFSEDQLLLLWQSIERRRPAEKAGSLAALLIGLKMAGETTHMPMTSAH